MKVTMPIKFFIGLVTMLIIAVVIYALQLISANNTAVFKEESIVASYQDSMNVKSSVTNRVSEMMQLPEIAKNDLIEVIEATFTGRYGNDGSQAMMNFIAENNLQLEQGIYTRIMNEISAGRIDFENAQRRVIDLKRSYTSDLRTVWTGFLMKQSGMPTINIGYPRGTPDDYPILLSESTREAFRTGVDAPMVLTRD